MPVKTIRAVTLAILFLVALALAFLSFALLLLAVVLCIFFALLAFLAAPEETKAFVRGSRDTVDAWVRAMVKLVEDAGRMMEAWMARFAGGTAQASEANAGEEEAAKKPEAASEDASDRPAPTKENALTETAKTTESVAKTPGEEEDGRPDVFGGAEALHRNATRHLGEVFLSETVKTFRRDVPRLHRVHRDPVGSEFDRGRAHEAELCGLGRPVVRPARIARDRARDGAREHNAPVTLLFHHGNRGLHREEGPLDVHVHDALEVGFRHLFELSLRENPCVGAEHVEAAPAFHGKAHHFFAEIALRHVPRDAFGFDAEAAEFFCGFTALVFFEARDEDVGARLGEHPRNAAADAA